MGVRHGTKYVLTFYIREVKNKLIFLMPNMYDYSFYGWKENLPYTQAKDNV